LVWGDVPAGGIEVGEKPRSTGIEGPWQKETKIKRRLIGGRKNG